MKELAYEYYKNYTNDYMSKQFIKNKKLQEFSTDNMYEFLKALIRMASDEGMRAQAEADYRIYKD